MTDEGRYQEILEAIGELKIEFAKTAQSFSDYKEARKNLPLDIQELKDRTARCGIECNHHTTETKSYFKKVDFLMTWYGRGAALIFAFQLLIAAMLLLSQIVDVKYSLKP